MQNRWWTVTHLKQPISGKEERTMKTEELKAKGLTDEQIAFVMAEHGKDLNALKKSVEDITAERDKEKARADEAESTLKGFDGVDVAKMNADIEAWKKKAEDVETEFKAKMAKRDFDDALKLAITKANGLNPKAIMALLDVKALRESNNRDADINEAIEALKQAEDSKMLFKAEEDPKPKPKFTNPSGKEGDGDGAGKLSAMSLDERIKLKREDPEAYGAMRG